MARLNNGEYPIIAIDGPGGAGKTTFARKLAEHLGGFTLTHGDDYYDPRPEAHPVLPGFFNAERLMRSIGTQLNAGERQLTYEPFDWELGRIVMSRQIVIGGVVHEGIKSFALPIQWDARIWVEAPRAVLEYRCVTLLTDAERRVKGSSRSELEARFNMWADEAEAYRRIIDPINNADCIIDGQLGPDEQLRAVKTVLRSVLPDPLSQ